MYKKSLMILLIILLAAAGGTFYGYYGQGEELTLDAAEKPKEAEGKLIVYVTGAVNQPGVVTLSEGARAADAVNACGGVLPTADMENVNLAQALKDGQQLRIPEKNADAKSKAAEKSDKTVEGKKTNAGRGGSSKKEAGGMVNINTADEAALDSLPGVGPAMAKRIIEFRQTEGAFQSIEDIKKVRGIGDAKFEKMKDRLTI